jgi:hypothetical protein
MRYGWWFVCVLGLLASSPVLHGQSFSGPNLINPLPGDTVVSADFNNDGNADLVYVQGSANTVAVSLSKGDGTFRSPVTSYAGSGPAALAVGDFNGDGKLDVAVTNTGGNGPDQKVAVLLGNGDGTFRSPIFYSVGGSPNSITVADLDNDGRPDIAVISTDKRITVLSNTGGSFTGRTFHVPTRYDLSVGGTQSDRTNNITSGDFNGDHKIDLAYVDECGPCDIQQETYWILTNKGGAQFTAAQGPTATGTLVLRSFDVDLDGLSDLVSIFLGCHTPCDGVQLNYSNGDGTWDVSAPYVVSFDEPTPFDVAVGDYNNDGKMDIAMIMSGGWIDDFATWINAGVTILDSQGGRTGFSAPVYFSVGGDMVDEFGRVLTSGYFRPVGREDLATNTDQNAIATWTNNTVSNNDPCPYPTRGGVHVCSPANNSHLGGTVHFVASARAGVQPLNRMELWVDGQKRFQLYNDRMDLTLTLSKGQHSADIIEDDAVGGFIKGHVTFTVQ